MKPGDVLAAYERRRIVLVGDDDMSGLIYFPAYYHYMSEADQEMFALLGHPVWDQIRGGVAAPTVHTSVDYHASAPAGTSLLQRVTLYAGRRTSTRAVHEFIRPDRVTAAVGTVIRAFVHLDTMQVRPIPSWLRDRANNVHVAVG